MAKLIQLKICNSTDHAIQSGKWKNPGASFYDKLLNAFYCDGNIPIDPKDLEKKSREGKYLQWNDFIKEAYLVAPIKNIKNSPYGVTPYSRSGCKYPHHVIRNGELVVSIPGLKAAYARAKQMGEFSGEVKTHLERHYKELGIYEDSTMKIQERIEQNFIDIERVIYEQTGIDLHCPSTLYEEDIDNGSIRPLLLSDVTNPYFVEWLFRSYEFSDDDPEKFDYDMLVNNDTIGNYAYGYFINDKLEGIIKVKHRKPEDYYAISMLFVNDQNESNGIGQTLMKYVINKFGDKEMRLNVFAFNARAIHIYKKYGFDIAQTVTTKPEADGSESKLTGIEMHKMVRKPKKESDSTDVISKSSTNDEPAISIFQSGHFSHDNIKHEPSSLEEIKNQYQKEGGLLMNDEYDDLDWITSYLMEDVESEKKSDTKKYEISHKKSKYKGWTEYTVHTKEGNDAASCIINPKTGDCADVETKPEYRRQGYMQYLLKYLIKFKGVKYAQVRQDNRIAISLYRKIGFEIEFKYNHETDKTPMYSMAFQGDPSKLIVEGYNVFTEAEEPPSMPGDEQPKAEEPADEKESMPKKTDKAESSKNGVRRKKLYIAFIEWCKEYNSKNTFGSIFDKDAFNVSYPFVPEEMRYFYRLANPMLCVLAGELTFFAASELRKLNAKNSHLNEMMIFAATPNDVRVFNVKDKKIYLGTEENGAVKLGVVLGDTFDTYIQKMINKGDILNAPLEEAVEFIE